MNNNKMDFSQFFKKMKDDIKYTTTIIKNATEEQITNAVTPTTVTPTTVTPTVTPTTVTPTTVTETVKNDEDKNYYLINNNKMDFSQIFKKMNDDLKFTTTVIKNAPEEQKTYYVPVAPTTVTTVTPTTVTPTTVTPTTTTVTETAKKDKDTTFDFLDDEVEIGDYKIKYKYIIGGVLLMVLLMKK